MYGMFGIETSIENIYKLAAPFVGDTDIEKMQDLKPSYVNYLKSVHSEFPILNDPEIVVRDLTRSNQFASAFSASIIDDLNQERMVGDNYSKDLLLANAELVQRSLAQLKIIRPDLAELFDLAVHAVVLCNSNRNSEGFSAHGGTTNRCIGLIWLNLRPEISEQNVLEMLIHELTHTLVFLDELNNEHFNYYNITKQEFWAQSSILKRQRPMDKVIHSIIVSMELLYTRKEFLPTEPGQKLLHPSSQELVKNISASIQSVLEHPRLHEVCKPRAIELVQLAKEQLKIYEAM
ncbi:hypothetical protein AZI86_05400 [Bdellovibrio bacteriovorus]|uniref:HEXXH motif domain-containing protein n=1 Tax=Bdellovibrio bacteriovorus TaxID=959 RepID=A0A150WPQ4_BDEBC|nr:HEXXH motif-containing putative peptide modification protein [Bdellovibrio bacteriovorus]KYG66483.1 hypothetical protein AZI86_05400 [Bdellovibrio bacteriovorus]